MSEAKLIIGDVFEVVASLPDRFFHSVITSPPYWKKRHYLPEGHPDIEHELGREPSPGEFLAHLLQLMDLLWDKLRDDGTAWINLGDTSAQSGGAGGDYEEDGLRAGQPKYGGSATSGGGLASNGKRRSPRSGTTMSGRRDGIEIPCARTVGDLTDVGGIPLAKSVCWIPQLFGASLAYGRNLLTGEPCRQWITRPPVTWCKPNPMPGEVIDRFRMGTELIIWASKQPKYYFDLDAIRLPPVPENQRDTRNQDGPKAKLARAAGEKMAGQTRYTKRTTNEKGAPPLDWWVIGSEQNNQPHFAPYPRKLVTVPIIASCPPGGWILDTFCGTGTTAMVATGNERNCILVDLDDRNADLVRERVGMFLTSIEHFVKEGVA